LVRGWAKRFTKRASPPVTKGSAGSTENRSTLIPNYAVAAIRATK
jgi:hypothetical protein